MSQQDHWQAHLSNASMPKSSQRSSMVADDSSTFMNPLHEEYLQSYSPYPFSPETALPPPPPGMYSQMPSQPRRNTEYIITIFVLASLVVALSFLKAIQLTAHTSLTTYPPGSDGLNQAGITSAQHAKATFKIPPLQTLTPGTIKENLLLTCNGCNDPVLTTINSITIDTTNRRLIWKVTLNNQSGAQQIDYFSEFSLQDPFGNTYEGTGDLHTDFFLGVGQRAFKTEIFSFLPPPSVSYTLFARLGISGITFDPILLTF